MEFAFDNLTVFMLVFLRMAGMLMTNPVISRRNVPARLRAGLVLFLAILLAPAQQANMPGGLSEIALIGTMLRELAVGAACGYVFNMFYYLLFFAGDVMDFQFGISMAKAFDPGTNIQMSVSGNLINVLFILYLFATDSHLLLIRIIASSYEVVPLGAQSLSLDIAGFMMSLFISAFSLLIRLLLPFMAVELILEASMGVLMKLIPQIHVFVISIQLKLLIGMFMLLTFAQPISDFVDRYMNAMFMSMQQVLQAMGA